MEDYNKVEISQGGVFKNEDGETMIHLGDNDVMSLKTFQNMLERDNQ